MDTKQTYAAAFTNYVKVTADLIAAWKRLEVLLPECTGKEADAVQAVRQAVRMESGALADLVMAAMAEMRRAADAPPADPYSGR